MNAMKAGDPDLEALRALFTELEFTSLLKELLPVVEVTQANYTEAKSADDVEEVLKAIRKGDAAGDCSGSRKQRRNQAAKKSQTMDSEEAMLPLTTQFFRCGKATEHRDFSRSRNFPHRLGCCRAKRCRVSSLLWLIRKFPSRCTISKPLHRSGQTRNRITKRSARFHALFLSARSHIFLASPCRCRFAPIQSQAEWSLPEAADVDRTPLHCIATRSRRSRIAQSCTTR